MYFSAFKNTIENTVGKGYLYQFSEFIKKLPCDHDIHYLEVDLRALCVPDITIGYNSHSLPTRLTEFEDSETVYKQLLKFCNLPIIEKPAFVWFEADKMRMENVGIHTSIDHKGMFVSVIPDYEKNTCIKYSELHGAELNDFEFFVNTFYAQKKLDEKIIHVSCLNRNNRPTLKYHTQVEIVNILPLLKHFEWKGDLEQVQQLVDQFKDKLSLSSVYIDFSVRDNRLLNKLGFYISKQISQSEEENSKKIITSGIKEFCSLNQEIIDQLTLEIENSAFENQWLDLKLVLEDENTYLKLYFGEKN